ncbi:MAG: ADP-ribosylglycohydrolase family protein, partial [Nitrospinales bacterium]
MSNLQNKILGSWFGMAVGDAMGAAVRGLKPATVAQCFGQMDGFKDVRRFIGKGVKQYRMSGLYGSRTQIALAVCDSLLKNKNLAFDDIATNLQLLAHHGPENYFGVYRRADAWLKKSLHNLSERHNLLPADTNVSHGGFISASIPVALYYLKNPKDPRRQCMETCLLLTRNPWEVTGAALTGFLIRQFAAIDVEGAESGLALDANKILSSAVDYCRDAEKYFKERYPEVWQEFGDEKGSALSRAFQSLREDFPQLEHADLLRSICRNASRYQKQPISHAAQGHVLTLLPLAVVMVLKAKDGFASALTSSLNMGGEADTLGVLTGALAGALYGYSGIPAAWKSSLVNAGEIKARGEALLKRKLSSAMKNFV